MYRIEDKKSATKEVQRLLGIHQTGVYDPATATTVKSLQGTHSLLETGVVDYQTFNVLVEAYGRRKRQKWDNSYLFLPSFPYKKGNFGENIQRINQALSIVLKNYFYENELPFGAYFGEATAEGVRYLREVFNIDGPDEIDEYLMNRIMLERDAIEIKEKYGL